MWNSLVILYSVCIGVNGLELSVITILLSVEFCVKTPSARLPLVIFERIKVFTISDFWPL